MRSIKQQATTIELRARTDESHIRIKKISDENMKRLDGTQK